MFFLLSALIVFAVMVVYPVVLSLFLAFTKWNFLSGWNGLKVIGLENFQKMFTKDHSFNVALYNTVIYAVTTVPISVFLALALAMLL